MKSEADNDNDIEDMNATSVPSKQVGKDDSDEDDEDDDDDEVCTLPTRRLISTATT